MTAAAEAAHQQLRFWEMHEHLFAQGTPTFFVNGELNAGGYDVESLRAAIAVYLSARGANP